MALRVVKPGLLTTVQDLGRWGHQNVGVSVAGPMDRVSHRLANLIVGNPHDAATLEITLMGPLLECTADLVFAVTGAIFDLTLDGRAGSMNSAVNARRGSHIVFGERTRGSRAYLAVAGGIDVPEVLGSRATHLPSRLGGIGGRALVAGDWLPIGPRPTPGPIVGRSRAPVVELPAGGARLRAIPGPQLEFFSEEAWPALEAARYVVTPQSNRMGYRLQGASIGHRRVEEPLSDATALGTLQIPADGQPILLMADCQTAGGYPKLATVISADMPAAGQLAPGDWVEFQRCDRREAMAALVVQERRVLV